MTLSRVLLAVALVVSACRSASAAVVETIAGGSVGDGLPAVEAAVQASGIAVDAGGNVYVAGGLRVRRIDAATGVVSSVVDGDCGSGTARECLDPHGLTFDHTGALLVTDYYGGRVFRVDPAGGAITRIAGKVAGQCIEGDGIPALAACLPEPADVAVDATGNVFIASAFGHRVYRLDSRTGLLWHYAGTGAKNDAPTGDGGPALQASIGAVVGITVGPAGDVFFATQQLLVWRVDHATGVITRVVGEVLAKCRDAGRRPLSARDVCLAPSDVLVDPAGNLLVSDLRTGTMRHVDLAKGLIAKAPGPAARQIARDGAGNLFGAAELRVTRTDARSGDTTVIAGNGTRDFCGDGHPATEACLAAYRVAYDARGNLFVLGDGHIRRIDAVTGVIETIAGEGDAHCPDASDDPIPACDACLGYSKGLAVDAASNVFFLDESENCDDRQIARVRRIDAGTGMVATVVGRWDRCTDSAVDGQPATDVCFPVADRLAFDPQGNLHFISQRRVLRVDRTTGLVAGVAGDGEYECDPDRGEDGPATAACLHPVDFDFDGAGDLFVSDLSGYRSPRVRRVDRGTGVITTVAGNGVARCTTDIYAPDGGPATAGCLGGEGALAVDAAGGLYLGETGRIRHVDGVTGTITTLAGSLDPLSRKFLDVYDLALHAGRLVFPDRGRRVLGLRVECAGDACVSPSPDTPLAPASVCPLHDRRLCLTDDGCDDGDPCTRERCDNGACLSYSIGGLAGAACRAEQLADATRCRGTGPALAARARTLHLLLQRFLAREEGRIRRAERMLEGFRSASARRVRRKSLPPRCATPIITRADELAASLRETRECSHF